MLNLTVPVVDAIPFDGDRRIVRCRTTIRPDGLIDFERFERRGELAGFYLSTNAGVIESKLDPPVYVGKRTLFTLTEVTT